MEEKKDWEQRLKEKELGNYTTCENEVIDFIKDLLLERETKAKREVLERILENIPVHRNLNWYEGEGWIMEDDLRNILSKLNKKK